METDILDAEEFRDLLHDEGEALLWLRARPHTCLNPAENVSTRDCTCDNGYVYDATITGVGVIQGVKREYMDPQFGLVRVGDCRMLTMPDEIPASEMDKIVLGDRVEPQKEIVKRGATARDGLRNPYCVDLLNVYDATGDYVVGTDCVLDNNGVKWLQNAPAAGVNYGVRYEAKPLFYVLGIEIGIPRPQGTKFMPMRCLLTRIHPGARPNP